MNLFSELALRQGVKLEGSVDSNVDPVMMDTQRIGRVLNNLIGNALRHTSAAGFVNVRAARSNLGVEIIDFLVGERAVGRLEGQIPAQAPLAGGPLLLFAAKCQAAKLLGYDRRTALQDPALHGQRREPAPAFAVRRTYRPRSAGARDRARCRSAYSDQ